MLREGLSILEEHVSPPSDDLAAAMHNLAVDLRRKGGSDVEAADLLARCIDFREQIYGSDFKGLAMPLRHLAYISAESGRLDESTSYLERAASIEEQTASELLSIGTEHDRDSAVAFLVGHANATLAFHLQYGQGNVRATALALEAVLRSKARLLEAMSDTLSALRQQPDEENRELLDQWTNLLEREAAWFDAKILDSRGLERALGRDEEFDELRTAREHVEKRIGVRVGNAPVRLTRVADLMRALPPDCVLIEYVEVSPIDFRMRHYQFVPAPRYVAFVVAGSREPVFVDLGEKARIDTRIADLRDMWGVNDAVVASLLAEIYELLIHPLKTHIGDASRLVIDPDSRIGTVPFCALKDEMGRFLIETYQITYTVAARNLTDRAPTTGIQTDPLIIADIDYGSFPPQNHRLGFPPLFHTRVEAEHVMEALPNGQSLTGTNALKFQLKQIASPRVIHIASHGFYRPDPRDSMTLLIHTFAGAPLPSPLLRCGLALSGANTDAAGILTGLEICGLDLEGTELVVLSTCVSSVGDFGEDSIYGLPRAFMIAGVESLVVSQFVIPDEATSVLMQRYYQRLKLGHSRGDALRQGQLDMVSHPSLSSPFNWASFMFFGRDEPMSNETWD